jgi:hypothetical protein
MGILNITNSNSGVYTFRTSSTYIHVDTTELKISQITLTSQEYLGKF